MIEVPDHYATNVGGAMVERAARVVQERGIVPAYLHQYADLWAKGLRFDGADVSFWTAVRNHAKDPSVDKTLRRQGL